MKIIITEDQYGQLMEIIKLDIKVGDTIMGGKFKNKKVVVKTIGKNDKGDITINGKPLLRFRIITESKHEEVILNYLNKVVHPDYDWGPELHKFYRDEVTVWGEHDFYINDVVGYSYVGNYYRKDSEYLYLLLIQPWLFGQLTSLFGSRWKPIFKEWFEKNSGLEVREMEVGY
jgi:hypothetical protein